MTRFGDLWLDNVWPTVLGLLCALPGVMEGANPLWFVAGPIDGWVHWQIGVKD